MEPFEVWLQDGALFNGFAISERPTGGALPSRLLPMTFGRAHRQRIAISREDEVSDVFERIDRNRYRSIRAKPAVLPDNCPQFPK